MLRIDAPQLAALDAAAKEDFLRRLQAHLNGLFPEAKLEARAVCAEAEARHLEDERRIALYGELMGRFGPEPLERLGFEPRAESESLGAYLVRFEFFVDSIPESLTLEEEDS